MTARVPGLDVVAVSTKLDIEPAHEQPVKVATPSTAATDVPPVQVTPLGLDPSVTVEFAVPSVAPEAVPIATEVENRVPLVTLPGMLVNWGCV